MPDLNSMTPEQLARLSPTGWSTSCDRGFAMGLSTASVKHWQYVSVSLDSTGLVSTNTTERVVFWHEMSEREYCDVCMNRMWERQDEQHRATRRHLDNQITGVFSVPGAILENSNLPGTGRIAGRASG